MRTFKPYCRHSACANPFAKSNPAVSSGWSGLQRERQAGDQDWSGSGGLQRGLQSPCQGEGRGFESRRPLQIKVLVNRVKRAARHSGCRGRVAPRRRAIQLRRTHQHVDVGCQSCSDHAPGARHLPRHPHRPASSRPQWPSAVRSMRRGSAMALLGRRLGPGRRPGAPGARSGRRVVGSAWTRSGTSPPGG